MLIPTTLSDEDFLRFSNSIIYRNCPKLIYCLWKSGRHAVMWLTCNTWKCVKCGIIKKSEMTQLLADSTVDYKWLHEIDTTDRQLPTISKFLRNHKYSSLSIKHSKGAYIITSDEATGKEWQSNTISRIQAIKNVYNMDTLHIRRRDFTLGWKPEPKYEPKKDTVVFTKSFESILDAQEELSAFGQDINQEFITGDPLDVLERLVKFGDTFTLELEGR